MNVPVSRSLRFVSTLAVVVALAALSPTLAVRGAEDENLPMASPEEVGMSSERLQRVSALMQRHIDQNLLAGTVSLIRQGSASRGAGLQRQGRQRGDAYRQHLHDHVDDQADRDRGAAARGARSPGSTLWRTSSVS